MFFYFLFKARYRSEGREVREGLGGKREAEKKYARDKGMREERRGRGRGKRRKADWEVWRKREEEAREKKNMRLRKAEEKC